MLAGTRNEGKDKARGGVQGVKHLPVALESAARRACALSLDGPLTPLRGLRSFQRYTTHAYPRAFLRLGRLCARNGSDRLTTGCFCMHSVPPPYKSDGCCEGLEFVLFGILGLRRVDQHVDKCEKRRWWRPSQSNLGPVWVPSRPTRLCRWPRCAF